MHDFGFVTSFAVMTVFWDAVDENHYDTTNIKEFMLVRVRLNIVNIWIYFGYV